MKMLIASDIHGSAYWCRKLTEAWDRENPERVLLLGDLLYHGPRNDLPDAYNPKEVLAMLNARKDRILCVRGRSCCTGIPMSRHGKTTEPSGISIRGPYPFPRKTVNPVI